MQKNTETKEAASGSSYIAPPVQRAAKLLKHIANGDPVENMAHTAKALKINRTTLLRLLHTLEAEGFIEKRETGLGYRVGLELLSIASRSFFSQDLVEVSLPIVTRLAEETGLSCHLGVLDGKDVLYLLRRTPNVPLTSNVNAGTRLPAHATTMGRIILAHMPLTQVEALYAGQELKQFTSRTPVNLADLVTLITADREEGIAWSDAFFESNISSAAVVLRNYTGQPVGAINVSGPTELLNDQGRRSKVASALKKAGAEASQRMGWIGDPARSSTHIAGS